AKDDRQARSDEKQRSGAGKSGQELDDVKGHEGCAQDSIGNLVVADDAAATPPPAQRWGGKTEAERRSGWGPFEEVPPTPTLACGSRRPPPPLPTPPWGGGRGYSLGTLFGTL